MLRITIERWRYGYLRINGRIFIGVQGVALISTTKLD